MDSPAISPQFTAPSPGSSTARAQGCTCPEALNHHGRGWHGSSACYIVRNTCPLHAPPAYEYRTDLKPSRRKGPK